MGTIFPIAAECFILLIAWGSNQLSTPIYKEVSTSLWSWGSHERWTTLFFWAKSWGSRRVVYSGAKTGIWGFPPNCKVPCQGWVYGVCVSQLFLPIRMWVPPSVNQCVELIQLVSRFFSEEIYLCVAVYLMHLWEGGKSEASHFTTLLMSLNWCAVLLARCH